VTDHAASHHPGHPRFLQVGESVVNPAHVGEYGVVGVRDNLAPRLPDPALDPTAYDAGAFSWSVIERPPGSEADLAFDETVPDERPRWTAGKRHTADFEPDVPGRYVFELDAPDGVHEWTWYVFPANHGTENRRPRLTLDGGFDEARDAFVIEPEVIVPRGGDSTWTDVETVFLADDRDPLPTAAVEQDDDTVLIPREALGGDHSRLHAAAWDGTARSMMDTVTLWPNGGVSRPNRPPAWATDGVLYQIFTRSWAGEPRETTMADLTAGVPYLDDLGVDVVWLTPVVPDEATARQFDQDLLADPYRSVLGGTLSGGGPHGYGALDYLSISPDLVPEGTEPVDAYRAFVDACHERGIRVVFDLAISHCGRSHPAFQDTIDGQGRAPPHPDLEYPAVDAWDRESPYFDWFDRIDRPSRHGCVDVEPRPLTTGFFGLLSLPNFSYNTLAVRERMLAVADFWSGEVGVDGFRCDIAWGVPTSFWTELGEVVRENDGEFLLLDETIPNDPRMGENAFDMHFDTGGFTDAAQAVAAREAPPERLRDAVEDRASRGFPRHSLVLNLVENHDEHRLLNSAVLDLAAPDRNGVDEADWETGAHRQRMCWAAGVVLPGVPGIYYGQERQISRYGKGRHRGVTDRRGRTADGVDVDADVRPGGRQRAFQNWDVCPEPHRQFYEDLVALYHDLDALGNDAELRDAWARTDDEVLVVGRDASHLNSVEGPERVIALLNFGTDPAQVAVRPSVGTRDLLSGDPVPDRAQHRTETLLELEDVLVLSAPDLFDVGSTVADLDPLAGTDHGPDEYTYPTGGGIEPGDLDVRGFALAETATEYQFRVAVGGGVTEGGVSEPPGQHLQVYVRDPEADGGSTEARSGVSVAFAAPYHYRVVVDGVDGVRVETHDGRRVATGDLTTNPVTDELLVSVPKRALDVSLTGAELAPLLLGYDGAAPGNVAQVRDEPGESSFGGAAGERAPNVIDTGFPAGFPNEEVLAYGEELARVPFVSVAAQVDTGDAASSSGSPGSRYHLSSRSRDSENRSGDARPQSRDRR